MATRTAKPVPHQDALPTQSLEDSGPHDAGAPEDTLVGRCLDGKFLIRDLIGEGSCGRVYLADQIALDRSVAVKVLRAKHRSDLTLPRRFHGEAFAASQLHHPNVISIYDYGQTASGLLYIAMEYLRGCTLRKRLREAHPLPAVQVIDLFTQVLSGLDEAHAAGVVHADLKSDNIVLHRLRDGSELAKIVDFGIARVIRRDTARAGAVSGLGPGLETVRRVSGTPGYLAPEIIDGVRPTALSDIYAAGVVLYEMLTGEMPFVGGSVDELLTRHLEGIFVPPSVRCPSVPILPGLEQAVMRALARDPGERFPNAASFRAAIEAVRGDASGIVCQVCRARHELRTRYCSQCGARMTGSDGSDRGDKARLDIEHQRFRGEQMVSQGQIREGLDRLHASIGMAIRLGDPALILAGYHALARMLDRTGDQDAAIREINEALDLVTAGEGLNASHGPEGLWHVLLDLADLYRRRGQIERALSACARALFHVRTAESSHGRAQVQAFMRRLYLEDRAHPDL